MILITHIAFLRKVKKGEEQRPEYRMPWAPFTDYISLAFYVVVVLSNLWSDSGRKSLALFAVVIVALIAGWFYARGRIQANLMDEMLDTEIDENQ